MLYQGWVIFTSSTVEEPIRAPFASTDDPLKEEESIIVEDPIIDEFNIGEDSTVEESTIGEDFTAEEPINADLANIEDNVKEEGPSEEESMIGEAPMAEWFSKEELIAEDPTAGDTLN